MDFEKERRILISGAQCMGTQLAAAKWQQHEFLDSWLPWVRMFVAYPFECLDPQILEYGSEITEFVT
jgi:hypothetical protein